MPSVESTVQSTDAVESLLLNENGLVGAALEHFGRCIEGGMTHKQILMQLQSVCASYACQGVKRNAGMTDNTKRQKTATNAYKEIVVPGFLKYLAEQSVPLPRWLTVEAMGCVNVSGLLSGKGASNKRETWNGYGHVERRRLGFR